MAIVQIGERALIPRGHAGDEARVVVVFHRHRILGGRGMLLMQLRLTRPRRMRLTVSSARAGPGAGRLYRQSGRPLPSVETVNQPARAGASITRLTGLTRLASLKRRRTH